MAISRSQMQRQLQNRGGITNLSPRQNFGLGSSLKKFARKIIPNEVSKVATAAAPFVAPFNPALAGAMAGIGSFDQTGSLSDAFKSGALTYGGGQAARYIGGAGFQGNPFASGGAFTPAGFTAGFSSPVGTDTGLGKLFSKPNAPISEVQPLGYEGSEVALTSGSPVDLGADTFTENMVFKDSIVPTSLNDYQGTKQVVDSVKENVFQRIMKDPSVSNIGSEALNAAKKAGKAIFFDKDGDLDKNILLGTIAFAASYAEAASIANEAGVDLTEAEYDEARKAEKQEQYASDLQNFFGGRKDGGRIGFQNGSLDVEALMENIKKYPEKVNEITDFEVGIFEPNEPTDLGPYPMDDETQEEKEAEMQKELAGEFGLYDMIDLEKPSGEENTPSQKIIDMQIESIENMLDAGKDDREEIIFTTGASPNLVDLVIKRRTKEADGGRIGFSNGTLNLDSKAKKHLRMVFKQKGANPDGLSFNEWVPLNFEWALGFKDGGRIGLREGTGSKKKYGTGILSGVKQIDPLQSGLNELKSGGGGIPMLGFSRLEKSFLFKNLAKLGGADRSFTMPQLYKILSNPSKFPKDAAALKAFLKVKGYQKGGDVGTAPEVPVRTNAAGVKELDYRQSGGFVPVGVKEKADDVPAMLSKNEFVLTADAVRGIGGGSVEKGSEKLYNVMKQAEQVGKA